MKAITKWQVDAIRKHTPSELVGSQAYPTEYDFGYYMPMGANWSYQAVYIEYQDRPLLVVKRFGQIMGRSERA